MSDDWKEAGITGIRIVLTSPETGILPIDNTVPQTHEMVRPESFVPASVESFFRGAMKERRSKLDLPRPQDGIGTPAVDLATEKKPEKPVVLRRPSLGAAKSPPVR